MWDFDNYPRWLRVIIGIGVAAELVRWIVTGEF